MRRSVFFKTLLFVLCAVILVSFVAIGEESSSSGKDRKQDVICMKIGKSLAFVHGNKAMIDKENLKVVPFIENGRTLIPLRFVSEALGAEVTYQEEKNGCKIEKDGKVIEITFGSSEFLVNGKPVLCDAPIKVTEGRTMVPLRFISEELGYNIYWNEKNEAVVISPPDNPWVEGREAEKKALNEMLVTMLFF